MVDVSAKPATLRAARASGLVRMARETLDLVRDRGLSKGDVLGVARLAGIMAAKRTGDLIPLCHPLGIDAVEVEFEFVDDRTLRVEVDASRVLRPDGRRDGGADGGLDRGADRLRHVSRASIARS